MERVPVSVWILVLKGWTPSQLLRLGATCRFLHMVTGNNVLWGGSATALEGSAKVSRMGRIGLRLERVDMPAAIEVSKPDWIDRIGSAYVKLPMVHPAVFHCGVNDVSWVVYHERFQGYVDPGAIGDAVLLSMTSKKITGRVSIFKEALGLKLEAYGPSARAGSYMTTSWMGRRVWGMFLQEGSVFVAYQNATNACARVAEFDSKTLKLLRDTETREALADISWTHCPDVIVGSTFALSSCPFRPLRAGGFLLLGLGSFSLWRHKKLVYSKSLSEALPMRGFSSSAIVGDYVFGIEMEEERDVQRRVWKVNFKSESATAQPLSVDYARSGDQDIQCFAGSGCALATFEPPPDMVWHDDEYMVTSRRILDVRTKEVMATAPLNSVFVSGVGDSIVYVWHEQDSCLSRLRMGKISFTPSKESLLGPNHQLTRNVRLKKDTALNLDAVRNYLMHVWASGRWTPAHGVLLGLPRISQREMAAMAQIAILQVALRLFGYLPLASYALKELSGDVSADSNMAMENTVTWIANETGLFEVCK